ncbi:MAG: hypothetical protein MH219_13320 [Marinobacter sp.]|nr:hypothetical protein [Marinobacter sp.]
MPVSIPRRKQDPLVVDTDEHPRATTFGKTRQPGHTVPRRRQRDGRQRLWRKRWRLRPAARQRQCPEANTI